METVEPRSHASTIRLDLLFAVAAAAVGVFLGIYLLLYNPLLVPVAVALTVFASAYLVFRRPSLGEWSPSDRDTGDNEGSLGKVAFAVSIVVFLAGVLSAVLQPEPYTRPTLHFLAMAVALALLGVAKFTTDAMNRLLLLALVAYSAAFIALPHLLFPDVLGIDPWAHKAITLSLVETGFMSGAFTYPDPGMNFFIGQLMIVGDLSDYKWASLLSVVFLQAVALTCIYYAGKIGFDSRVGFVSALLLAGSGNFVKYGFWLIPQFFALLYLPIILYLITRRERTVGTSVAILVLAAATIITHSLSAFALLILLAVFYVSRKLFALAKARPATVQSGVGQSFVLLFAVATVGWWIFASGFFVNFVSLFRLFLQLDLGIPVQDLAFYNPGAPYLEHVANLMPLLMFYGLATLGWLYSLSKGSNLLLSSLAWGASIVLLLPFIGLLTEAGGLFIERYVLVAQVLFAIPAAVGLLLAIRGLKGLRRRRPVRIAFVFVLLSTFVFFNLLSPLANMDNPSLSPNSVARYAFLQSERTAVQHVATHYAGPLYSDPLGIAPFWGSEAIEGSDLIRYLQVHLTLPSAALLLRSDVLVSPFWQNSLGVAGDSLYSESLGLDRVYDVGPAVFLVTSPVEH